MEKLKAIYFFDTYAFFEIIDGGENYKRFEEHTSVITTKLNLMELHFGLLKKHDKEIANFYYDKLLEFCVDIEDEIIKQANEFKLLHNRRDLSYVDCIGYILARRRGVPFLTGDEQFKDFENVEFVK